MICPLLCGSRSNLGPTLPVGRYFRFLCSRSGGESLQRSDSAIFDAVLRHVAEYVVNRYCGPQQGYRAGSKKGRLPFHRKDAYRRTRVSVQGQFETKRRGLRPAYPSALRNIIDSYLAVRRKPKAFGYGG